MSGFEKVKEKLPRKENLYSLLTSKKNNDKEYQHVLKVWDKFEMKTMKDYHDCDTLLLNDVFEKPRNVHVII